MPFLKGSIYPIVFTFYQLQDLFSEKSNFIIMKTDESGRLEIISKKGKKITAIEVTKKRPKAGENAWGQLTGLKTAP